MLIRIFQGELEKQCQFVLAGVQDLQEAHKNPGAPGAGFAIWRALQEILVAAANIARMFWGTGGERTAQRTPLRSSIGIDETSPLYAWRVRNDLEHLDERLERWWRDDPRHIYVGRHVGAPEEIVIEGGIPQQRFVSYDPRTTIVRFWSNEASIMEICREIERILPAVQREHAKPPWD